MLVWIVGLTNVASAESDDPVAMTVQRGLTGQVNFSHRSATLQSLPDQSIDAPVLVRLECVGEPSATSGPEHRYTLSFFGAVAGQYNLSDWVVQRDGSPLKAADVIPAMNVQIVSQLPPEQGTNLYEIEDPSLAAPRGYRALLGLMAVLWFLVPMIGAVIWWRSRETIQPTPTIAEPTLADRLRPLVQRASEGELTVDEQSRMELLLYVFWQRRFNLSESLVAALPVLRRHAEAGELLRSLEAWIHADASDRPPLSPATMDALLAPYHAMCEDDLQREQADALENAA